MNSIIRNKRVTEYRLIILLIPILCLFSCHKTDRPIVKDIPRDWDRLVIDSEKQRIVIDEGFDYGRRCFWDWNEIDKGNGKIERNPINYEEEKFIISKQEQDSLFVCIYDIVSNPVHTEQFATCYAGSISVSYTIGTISLTCSYNSVGNWTTISPQLNKLYSMLKRKTEISEQ
jgi:hypothetical protein